MNVKADRATKSRPTSMNTIHFCFSSSSGGSAVGLVRRGAGVGPPVPRPPFDGSFSVAEAAFMFREDRCDLRARFVPHTDRVTKALSRKGGNGHLLSAVCHSDCAVDADVSADDCTQITSARSQRAVM